MLLGFELVLYYFVILCPLGFLEYNITCPKKMSMDVPTRNAKNRKRREDHMLENHTAIFSNEVDTYKHVVLSP